VSGPAGVAGLARGRPPALLAAWLLGGLALVLIVASVDLDSVRSGLAEAVGSALEPAHVSVWLVGGPG
jgi:hypothetical protein